MKSDNPLNFWATRLLRWLQRLGYWSITNIGHGDALSHLINIWGNDHHIRHFSIRGRRSFLDAFCSLPTTVEEIPYDRICHWKNIKYQIHRQLEPSQRHLHYNQQSLPIVDYCILFTGSFAVPPVIGRGSTKMIIQEPKVRTFEMEKTERFEWLHDSNKGLSFVHLIRYQSR